MLVVINRNQCLCIIIKDRKNEKVIIVGNFTIAIYFL